MKFADHYQALNFDQDHAIELDAFFDVIESRTKKTRWNQVLFPQDIPSGMEILIQFALDNDLDIARHSVASFEKLTDDVISILEAGGRNTFITKNLPAISQEEAPAHRAPSATNSILTALTSSGSTSTAKRFHIEKTPRNNSNAEGCCSISAAIQRTFPFLG